ncbi:hypothetical protein GF325_03140 [Candidatus Bathyarchaeota archaeon]|nr:hypothetical protein [Candidatus Bathyarchaeota archaeon]
MSNYKVKDSSQAIEVIYMNATVNQGEDADLAIDRSRRYKINAGQCNRCGFYKTWEFRFKNPKSGKMMPGHVTEDGFKINDGGCPYWATIKKNRKGTSIPSPTSSFPSKTARQVFNLRDDKVPAPSCLSNGAPGSSGSTRDGSVMVSRRNGTIMLEIQGDSKASVELEHGKALQLIKDLASLLC